MRKCLAIVATLLVAGVLSAQATERQATRQKARAARAMLVSPTGATVATASLDPSGRCVFNNVPEGEYKVVLTSEDGRTVTIGDLDGDGRPELFVAGAQDQTRIPNQNSARSNHSPALSAGSEEGGGQKAQDHNSSRSNKTASAAAGLPTGKRTHKPFSCVAGWDGKVKGPFSEAAARSAASSSAEPAGGACVVKVHCPTPSTVQIESWSFGASQSGT